ncbi:acyltransferase family protein [Halobacillus litoralis]|uniref:Acyltransferase 3 domain-containing protein n=1 Tax=Halobacillus litoralis TaxID=45668 RepID=A0A410MFC1_9BACI|nr:acyltransferase family protein [Halobacillus litoralis]QAS53434.1 hypothetical protein HLI_15120 [Halobacillus litoralis]
MKRTMIDEIFFIRFIACLTVVFIHSITVTQHHYTLPDFTVESFYMFKMTLMFATPVFVMISEFLLSYSYEDRLPKSFWKKRIMYILIPYIIVAFIYSAYPLIIDARFNWGVFFDTFIAKTLLGKWHGYFVLIIFQFYALHFLLKRVFDRFHPALMIGLSLAINLFYLAMFNFQWFQQIPWIAVMLDYYKLPFLGWIFYFTIAYYAGKNIDTFLNLLKKYKYVIIGGVLLTGLVPLLMRYNKIYSIVSSKRFDIVLYTLCIFCLLYLIAQKIKKNPAFVMWISSSSYSIYLLHPLFQYNVKDLLQNAPFYTNLGVHILLLFGIGTGGPLLVSYLLNKVPFGAFIVGKFKVPKSISPEPDKLKVS